MASEKFSWKHLLSALGGAALTYLSQFVPALLDVLK